MSVTLRKHTTKTKKMMIAGIVVCLCLAIAIGYKVKSSSPAGSQTSANNKLQTTADVLEMSRTGLVKRISLTGQTVPEAQVDIVAKYAGKITGVNGSLGQVVSAGDVLIIQDTGDVDISIRQNQAAYNQASADATTSDVSFHASYDKAMVDYQRAISDYQRNRTLHDQGAISQQSLDVSEQSMLNAKSTLDSLANQMNSSSVPSVIVSAQATAAKAAQSVNAVEKQREDLILRAPRSGVISYRQAEVGGFAPVGQKLLSIVDNSQMYVDCKVSEQDLPALTQGMDINVQIQSLSKTFNGTIVYISPAADSTDQSFSLRIALRDIDSSVKTGMFTKTIINTILRPNALVAPKSAILEKGGKSYVFVMNAQSEVEERVVQIGARGDENVEIVSGLADHEHIVISNLSRLKTGMKITPNIVTQNNRGDSQ